MARVGMSRTGSILRHLTLVLALVAAAGAHLCAQSQSNDSGKSQPQTSSQNSSAQPAATSNQQDNRNPFPEDTSDVPVIPTHSVPPDASRTPGRISMPASDSDPVRTPEEAEGAAENGQQNSSSSLAGTLPSTDDDAEPSKHNRKDQPVEPEHHETAAEDESVGSYYLDNKDWKAALSRFQSALVLDPANPDVYWGLAEAERHLGRFAEARANYQLVMAYDPGSHHAKEAKKALEDPQIASAK